jgi:hypothetical protein
MTTRPIEFIIDGLVAGERATVIGCCGDEPIHLGDEFDSIYRLKKRRYPDEVGDEPVREVEHPVSLKVVCIHAYDRSLPVLGQGSTGSIAIDGRGVELIAPGWVLGRRELQTVGTDRGVNGNVSHAE